MSAPPAQPRPDKYYPNLFNRPQEEQVARRESNVIPHTTLYDMPLQAQHTPQQKHVTVFGFSQQNRPNVLTAIRKILTIERKEEGKNYVDVWAKDPVALDRLLGLNCKSINGEIIGVFRRNFGAIQDQEIYVKKKGILQMVKEYLFGES